MQILTREDPVRNWAIQFSGGNPTVGDDLPAIIGMARDLERVERCGIHYATPDGRVIPFCSYNSLHREDVERRFSVPLEGGNERMLSSDLLILRNGYLELAYTTFVSIMKTTL